MSYGLIYTVPFATLDNIPCVVEIEKEDYVGASTELTAGATPFTIDIDSEEFLYTPTRFSTAKLQVVGSDYLQSLFSTAYKEFRVTLKKNGVITWCGFIKPELYTQDYTAKTFTLEIECISAMSVLEFIDYSIEGESKNSFHCGIYCNAAYPPLTDNMILSLSLMCMLPAKQLTLPVKMYLPI